MMKKVGQLFASAMRGLCASLVASSLLSPGPAMAQQTDFDPEWFDCLELRRDGSFLVYWERFVMNFTCQKSSCVNRGQVTDADGLTSEVFRHIYLPKDRKSFVLTTSVWKEGNETPESVTSRTRFMVGCFTMTPDEELWTIDLGEARYEGNEVHSDNKIGDYRADYFYAPKRLLGDWLNVTAIEFDKMSSGGSYMSAYFEDIYGDVVLKNGSMRATYEIPEHHTGEWRRFRVDFDDPSWRLQGGATSIDDILENVSVFQIRSEYASGPDESAIRNVVIE